MNKKLLLYIAQDTTKKKFYLFIYVQRIFPHHDFDLLY